MCLWVHIVSVAHSCHRNRSKGSTDPALNCQGIGKYPAEPHMFEGNQTIQASQVAVDRPWIRRCEGAKQGLIDWHPLAQRRLPLPQDQLQPWPSKVHHGSVALHSFQRLPRNLGDPRTSSMDNRIYCPSKTYSGSPRFLSRSSKIWVMKTWLGTWKSCMARHLRQSRNCLQLLVHHGISNCRTIEPEANCRLRIWANAAIGVLAHFGSVENSPNVSLNIIDRHHRHHLQRTKIRLHPKNAQRSDRHA